MKKSLFAALFALLAIAGTAQPGQFTIEKQVAATPVKNQAATGTCWCFSTTSLVESQCMKKSLGTFDISEMFAVRNIYIEKAKNYILRQGHAQFSEGGLGHDLIRAIHVYGAVPESVYSGLSPKYNTHNHQGMVRELKAYLDTLVKNGPVPRNWLEYFTMLLDGNLGGTPPAEFQYNGKKYTPKTFASEVLKFDPEEYVNITSFTHHPFYAPFIIEVPDNFSNGKYYNLPLDEMVQLTKNAIRSGYSVLWDADVSNSGFRQNLGIATNTDLTAVPVKMDKATAFKEKNKRFNQQKMTDGNTDAVNSGGKVKDTAMARKMTEQSMDELPYDPETRQLLFETLVTQDDHLMHITGIAKAANGKTYFKVKNSWGDIGPDHGYINVSEGYFATNTISLIVPKAAVSRELLNKLGIR